MRFGGVVALQEVSLSVRAGRVTCLLGENGAGKSTLIKVLCGACRPTSGRVLLDGRPVEFASPRQALAQGIATVHQDLGLIPLLSVWRNFFLGAEPTRGRGLLRRLDMSRCLETARRELEKLGIRVRDASQPAGTLSGGERQVLAIARALYRGARALILDEPTAALGLEQARLVLDSVRRAQQRGVAVLLVTHNPQHAHAAGDRFVVLRQGCLVGDYAAEAVGPVELERLLAGTARPGE